MMRVPGVWDMGVGWLTDVPSQLMLELGIMSLDPRIEYPDLLVHSRARGPY